MSSLLSRRHFLQLAGIAIAASRLPSLASATPSHAPAPALHTTYGRALATIPVYAAPSVDAPVLQRLWSDTVVPIVETEGGWYRLPQGYTPREGLQPMMTAVRSAETAAPPFWGTVAGAVAVVRAYCAANAPVVTRVGHGGVLRVVDMLSDAKTDWYAVADDENSALLGWVVASVVAPLIVDDAAPTLTLAVDAAAFRLDVYDGDLLVLTAPAAVGQALARGTYPVTTRSVAAAPQQGLHGVPYAFGFGDNMLTGAYWHNRFGAPSPGATLQITPPLAQWLYPRAAEIIIS